MSVASIFNSATGKIFDDLIPQGGGIPLTKGQLISADATGEELAVPVGANGTILSADDTQIDGLRWIPVPGAVALAQGELISANQGGDATIVPAPQLPAQANYVLSADATAPTNLLWKPPTGAGGLINATAPLVDDAGVGTNTISINFTQGVKGELVAGNGVAKTGILVPPAGPDNYVLTSDASTASGLSWKALGGSGVITALAPLQDLEPVAGTNEISINFSAVKAEIPAGTGVAKTGALVPAPAHDGYVLKADAGEPTGLIWSAVTETLTAQAPLLVEEPQAGDPQISIAFTAVKGEIPAGTGASSVGGLVPAPPADDYVLTSDASTATGLAWKAQGSGSAPTIFRNSNDLVGLGITKPTSATDTCVLVADRTGHVINPAAVFSNIGDDGLVQGITSPFLLGNFTPAHNILITGITYTGAMIQYATGIQDPPNTPCQMNLCAFNDPNTVLASGVNNPLEEGGEPYTFNITNQYLATGGTQYSVYLVFVAQPSISYNIETATNPPPAPPTNDFTGTMTYVGFEYQGLTANFGTPIGSFFRLTNDVVGKTVCDIESFSSQSFVASADAMDWIVIGATNGGVSFQ